MCLRLRTIRGRLTARWLGAVALSMALGTLGAAPAVAQSQIRVVSTDAAPAELDFTPSAQQAGALDVTVTDLAAPSALQALRVAVTQGATLVATGSANGGTPSTVTVTFTATANVAYAIRVIGRPDTKTGSGTVIATITPSKATTPVYASLAPTAFQVPVSTSTDAFQLPDQAITFANAGTYSARLSDLSLPAPFQALNVLLCPTPCTDASQYVTLDPVTQTSRAFTAAAGSTYRVRVVGTTAAGTASGLFSLRVTDAGGAQVFPAAGNGVIALGSQVSGGIL